MRKTLTSNETLVITPGGGTFKVHLALISGDVEYSIGKVAATGDNACILNEDIRTDTIDWTRPKEKGTVVHIKAGSTGAAIQYRME